MYARPIVMTLLLAAAPIIGHALDRSDADLAITQAGTALQAADRADAARFAPPDLASAHDLFDQAQAAYDHRHWTESVLAAESAKVDADLAAARSRQHRAEDATAEVERSVQSLREQLGMAPGDQP